MKEKIEILLTVEIEYIEPKDKKDAIKNALRMAKSGRVLSGRTTTNPIKCKLLKNETNTIKRTDD